MTRDNWSFPNNKDNFGADYFLTDADMTLLLRGLNTAEQDYMHKQCSAEWKGACYGMACTSILAWNGLIDLADYGASSLYGISGPPSGDVLSLINCYQLSQKLPTKRLEAANELKKPEKEKLAHLIEECETGKPVLLTFRSLGVAHAMVAYSIDYGRWTVDEKTFSARILTYDPSKASFHEDSCLYYDASTGNWVIPEYGASTYVAVKKSRLGICTADPENFILHSDPEAPRTPTAVDAYKVILEYEGAMPVPEIRELTYSDGTWNDAEDDNDILEFSDIYGDITLQLRAFKKADAAYRLTASGAPQDMRASIFYDSNIDPRITVQVKEHISRKAADPVQEHCRRIRLQCVFCDDISAVIGVGDVVGIVLEKILALIFPKQLCTVNIACNRDLTLFYLTH